VWAEGNKGGGKNSRGLKGGEKPSSNNKTRGVGWWEEIPICPRERKKVFQGRPIKEIRVG